MGYHNYYYLYYGIKINHEEAKRVQEFFLNLGEEKHKEEDFFLKSPYDEQDFEDFSLEMSFEICDLEDVNLAGQYANSVIENITGYIEHDQDDIPYYVFGIDIAERKTKFSAKEKKIKESKIIEKWNKLLPYLEKLNLQNNPQYTIIQQVL